MESKKLIGWKENVDVIAQLDAISNKFGIARSDTLRMMLRERLAADSSNSK
jgi:hypothetical protein